MFRNAQMYALVVGDSRNVIHLTFKTRAIFLKIDPRERFEL